MQNEAKKGFINHKYDSHQMILARSYAHNMQIQLEIVDFL